jgi:hypothetical protein
VFHNGLIRERSINPSANPVVRSLYGSSYEIDVNHSESTVQANTAGLSQPYKVSSLVDLAYNAANITNILEELPDDCRTIGQLLVLSTES